MSFQNFLTENFSKTQVKRLSVLTVILSCVVSYSGVVSAGALLTSILFAGLFYLCLVFPTKDWSLKDFAMSFFVTVGAASFTGAMWADSAIALVGSSHSAIALTVVFNLILTIVSIRFLIHLFRETSDYLDNIYAENRVSF